MLLPIKYTVHDKAATGSMNNEYIYIYIYILVCISIVDVCCLGYFESINPGPFVQMNPIVKPICALM